MPYAHFTVHMSAYRDEDRKLAAFVACVKTTTSFTYRMEFHIYPFESINVHTTVQHFYDMPCHSSNTVIARHTYTDMPQR